MDTPMSMNTSMKIEVMDMLTVVMDTLMVDMVIVTEVMDIVTVDIHTTEGLIHTFLLLQAGKINWPNVALPPSWILLHP